MRERIIKKYTSIFLICILLSSLILQNAYALSLPVLGQGEKATASNATASDALASGSDWGKFTQLDGDMVLLTAAAETTDFAAGNELEIYVYVKNAGDGWIYDGSLECLAGKAMDREDDDEAEITDCFINIEQMDENGEWILAEFPEDVIGYDMEQLQEPELNGLALAPGMAYRITYQHTVEDSEEPTASGLEFRFKGETEAGDRETAKTWLFYNIDGWNLEMTEADDTPATASDAEITVRVNGWQDLMDQEEEASASNASEYAELKMNTLSWKMASDVKLEEVEQTENGDGTVTFRYFLPDGQPAEPYLVQVAAKGSYKGKEYQSSTAVVMMAEGEPAERVTAYRYEDDDVIVNADVVSENRNALPAGSELMAERITDPAELELIAEKILQETGEAYDCSRAYDIRFEYEGEEIEPEDAVVRVRIQYKEAVELHESAKQDPQQEVKMLHLTKDDTVEDVTDEIATDADGDVEAASFEASSFSIFVLTQTIPAVPNGTSFKYEDDTVTITARVAEAAGIPADAKLVVDVVGEDDPRFQEVKTRLEEQEDIQEQETIIKKDWLMYDYYFRDANEQKLEVGADVEIQLDFVYKMDSTQSGTGVSTYAETADAEEESEPITAYQLGPDAALNAISGIAVMGGAAVRTMSVTARGTNAVMVVVPNGNSYEVSSETLFTQGGDYSLYYILNNFNIFSKGTVQSGHCIGPVAVGGEAYFGAGNGNGTYKHTTPTYLEGEIKILLDGFMKSLYVGEVNKNIHFTNQARCTTYISEGDKYIDFTEAFRQIQAEADGLAGMADVTVLTSDIQSAKNGKRVDRAPYYIAEPFWKKGVKLTVYGGYSYRFENLSEIGAIDVDETANPFGNAALIDETSKAIELPQVYINGKSELQGDREAGDGLAALFILPNTESVDCSGAWERWIGHIVAPRANVKGMIGDANGCTISASYTNPSTECHMFPYRGDKLQEASLQLKLGKTIDNKIPDGSNKQTFSFVLQEMHVAESAETVDVTIQGEKLKEGVIIESKTNNFGVIDFSSIGYSSKSADGVYYYKVYEKPPTGDTEYVYDKNCYYIKVTVSVLTSTVGTLTTTKVTIDDISYWKAAGDMQSIETSPAILPINKSGRTVVDLSSDAVFNNTTKGQVVLPETGGTGLQKFFNISMCLLLFGMMGITNACQIRKKTF